jgi:uncharacterized protein (DUF983 family)
VPVARVPAALALRRALRGRCAACGVGSVFGGTWRSAARCSGCGWRFERGPGHWVGGNEVNLLLTFPVSVAALAVPALSAGPSWTTAAAGGLFALVLGIAAHRPTRCVFFAIDYLVDPTPDAGDDGDDDDGDGDDDAADGGPPRGDGSAPAPLDGGGGAPPPPRIAVVDLPVRDPSPRPDAEPCVPPRPAPAPHSARPAPRRHA